MITDKEHQEMKVQYLDVQVAYFRQQIELASFKIEKIEDLLRKERMILMGLEREHVQSNPPMVAAAVVDLPQSSGS